MVVSAMGLIERLADDAGVSLTVHGSLHLVAAKDAERILSAIEKTGVVVLGIEGFHLRNGRISPDIEAIADFSDVSASTNGSLESVASSRQFMNRVRSHGLFVEFTIRSGQ
jgi:hypothetical protein